jgi:hypothetical protein
MPNVSPETLPAWGFSATAELSPLDLKELENLCPYAWVVETRYSGGRIVAGFVGSVKGRKRYGYRHELSTAENHVAAAAAFLQGLASCNGAHAYRLVAKASATHGFVFTFR